jgi:uncharacterized protein
MTDNKITQVNTSTESLPGPLKGTLTRRNFLKKSSLFLGAASLTSLSVAGSSYGISKLDNDTFALDFSESDIQIPLLPKEFENYKIGFLTDIHLGPSMPYEFIEYTIAKLLDSRIDLLLLGGDYVWTPESLFSEMIYPKRNPDFIRQSHFETVELVFQALTKLMSSVKIPDGIYGVFGNHDRRWNLHACEQTFAGSSITLLINTYASITRGTAKLILYGVDDYMTGIPEPMKFIDERESVRILLSHNPDFAADTLPLEAISKERMERGYFDLALCGHTHGGQIKLPLVGPPVYNIRDLRFKEGQVILSNGTHDTLSTSLKPRTLATEHFKTIYTSRGIGTVELPWRFNCPPEVNIFRLKGL